MEEIWKAVIGYEGRYEVSNMGNIKSLTRTILRGGKTHKLNGKILSVKSKNHDYIRISLSCRGSMLIHRVIAESFLPKLDGRVYVNHKNGIKTDNRVENLEWCTHKENMIHCYKNKLLIPYDRTGENNPRYKDGKRTVINKPGKCLTCGTDFIRKLNKSVYCSRSCSSTYSHKIRRASKEQTRNNLTAR